MNYKKLNNLNIMFLKKLDIISPKISIYHKGSLTHSSIASGIISIFAIIFIFIIVIYYSLDMIQKKNPKVYNIDSYIEDVPTFKVNYTSFFHFINIVTVGSPGGIDGIDFKKFRIIGSKAYYSNFLHTNLKSITHWVYGPCDNSSDLGELGKLITYDYFQKCACIKKYYDHKNNKYFNINNPNFKWPEIGHGLSHDNNIMYNIYIQNCNDNLIGEVLGDDSQCNNITEINKYFQIQRGQKMFHLYFLDHYINNSDYRNPIKPYFTRIETPYESDQYTVHNIKFNPSLIKTDHGIIFEDKKEELSYEYDRNEEYIKEKGEKDDIYISYSFLFKNVMIESERKYKRIQDIISEIGGFYKFAQLFAFYLNYYYNCYIVLQDTQILLNDLIQTEKGNINTQKNMFQKLNNLKDIEGKNEKPKEKDKNEISSTSRINNIRTNKSKSIINPRDEDSSNINSTNLKMKQLNSSIDRNKIKNLVLNNENTLKSYHTSFYKFLLYKLSCEKKNNYYQVYHNFRIKIISEEHFIRSHLNIYNLLKANTKKGNRNKRRYSYQIKDLMNLI